jgi:hypothetical protein
MSGLWITQSTYYSLIDKNQEVSHTLINKVDWRNISCDSHDYNLMLSKLSKKYIDGFISLYQTESLNNKLTKNTFYVLFLKTGSKNISVLKFNKYWRLISQATVRKFTSNYCCLISDMHNFTVIQKIYFLNNNVKIIKSIIKKSCQCIATSFSSELKIS